MKVPVGGARWTFDTLHMGRSSVDLYSNDVGAAFEEIRSFGAYVGGSRTNVAVGIRRLGLRSALLTAVGDDPVADLVLRFLEDNGVEVGCSPRKPGHRTSAALLGIEPPDRFSLVSYRDNCADVELTIDDVLAAPVTASRLFESVGTNLSREPSRSATLFAAERARDAGARVVFDLDFRPDHRHDPRAFGVAARGASRLVDIVVGTQDELRVAALRDRDSVEIRHSQVTEARVGGTSNRPSPASWRSGPPRWSRSAASAGHGSNSPTARWSRRRGSRSTSSTSGARATRSPPARSTDVSRVAIGTSRHGWATPAGRSWSPGTDVPTSCRASRRS